MSDLATIATITIVTKVVAAENYEQLACTRKNSANKEWVIAADTVNSAVS